MSELQKLKADANELLKSVASTIAHYVRMPKDDYLTHTVHTLRDCTCRWLFARLDPCFADNLVINSLTYVMSHTSGVADAAVHVCLVTLFGVYSSPQVVTSCRKYIKVTIDGLIADE